MNITHHFEELPFKMAFTHASFERESSGTLWVQLSDKEHEGIGESCPRVYVTGENAESMAAFFTDPRVTTFLKLPNLQAWRSALREHREWIDRHPSAFCALEMAWLDLVARRRGSSVEEMWGGQWAPRALRPSMVLGIGHARALRKGMIKAMAAGFRDVKIKISAHPEELERVETFFRGPLARLFLKSGGRFRLDANNAFSSYAELAPWLLKFPVWAIEEPFATDNQPAILELIKDQNAPLLILDESLVRPGDLDFYIPYAKRVCLNLRVSKLGGVLRAREMMARAGQHRIPWGLGCQVGETSLLTRAALAVVEGHETEPVFYEGAFSDFLLKVDPIRPKLRLKAWSGVSGQVKVGPKGWGMKNGKEKNERR